MDRVIFLDPLSRDNYINHLGTSSVLLDPLYFGAGNSFHESMVYGTPTVTMPTKFIKSRIVSAAYMQMEIEKPPIVKNKNEYVELAIDIANSDNLLEIQFGSGDSNKNDEGKKIISDLPFSQFLKSEISYIKHWDLGESSTFATRYFVGFALPYGNSDNIPFSESFFAGGSNDNRAWEVYRLGPGSSGATDEFNEGNFKIAMNFEYRFKKFKHVRYSRSDKKINGKQKTGYKNWNYCRSNYFIFD